MDCYRDTTLEIEHKARRTMFPHLKINFNLLVQTRFLNYKRDPHSGTGPELIQGLRNSGFEAFASDSIILFKDMSYDGVREAAEGVVSDAPLLPDERQCVVDCACGEVRELCGETLLKYIILDIDIKVVIEHLHVYTEVGKIPAADSAMGLPEKCEAGCAGAEAERCCCICSRKTWTARGGGADDVSTE